MREKGQVSAPGRGRRRDVEEGEEGDGHGKKLWWMQRKKKELGVGHDKS